MKHTLIQYLSILCAVMGITFGNAVSAQNTLIVGKVHKDVRGLIELKVDTKYIDNQTNWYSSDINPDGKFGFAFQLDFPQFVTLKYNRNYAELFLEPGDSLYVEFEAETFRFSMTFAGRGGDNNTCWLNYANKFTREHDEFDMVYLGVGAYYYRVPSQLDSIMRISSPDEFVMASRRLQMHHQDMIDFALTEGSLKLSPKFLAFMQAEINYSRAYRRLCYGHLYGGRYSLGDDFFAPLSELALSDDNVFSSPQYREYVMAWINYVAMSDKSPDDPYKVRYDLAKRYLSGLARSYYQVEIISKCFRDENYDEAVKLYDDFIKTNPYEEFDTRITESYQLASRFAAGSPAPDFTLTDVDGKSVKLSQFKGKVVYLNFWATWCRPCVQKMQLLKGVEEELEKTGKVVFIHVSLDRNPNTWMDFVKSQGLGGHQVMVMNPSDAVVTQKYDVQSVPKFFIITKQGNFALSPPTTNPETIFDTLKKLSD